MGRRAFLATATIVVAAVVGVAGWYVGRSSGSSLRSIVLEQDLLDTSRQVDYLIEVVGGAPNGMHVGVLLRLANARCLRGELDEGSWRRERAKILEQDLGRMKARERHGLATALEVVIAALAVELELAWAGEPNEYRAQREAVRRRLESPAVGLESQWPSQDLRAVRFDTQFPSAEIIARQNY